MIVCCIERKSDDIKGRPPTAHFLQCAMGCQEHGRQFNIILLPLCIFVGGSLFCAQNYYIPTLKWIVVPPTGPINDSLWDYTAYTLFANKIDLWAVIAVPVIIVIWGCCNSRSYKAGRQAYITNIVTKIEIVETNLCADHVQNRGHLIAAI